MMIKIKCWQTTSIFDILPDHQLCCNDPDCLLMMTVWPAALTFLHDDCRNFLKTWMHRNWPLCDPRLSYRYRGPWLNSFSGSTWHLLFRFLFPTPRYSSSTIWIFNVTWKDSSWIFTLNINFWWKELKNWAARLFTIVPARSWPLENLQFSSICHKLPPTAHAQ